MPELAEVFFNCSHWKKAKGERFRLAWAHTATRCCRHLDIEELENAFFDVYLKNGYTHGKRMLFSFSSGIYLEVHLGMTGSLSREASDKAETKHEHLALKSQESTLVFRDPRQFGKIALHRGEEGELPEWWRSLPVQPQEKGFTLKRFREITQRRGGSVLKSLLLQQEFFPGVGNWMADEILWRARLRPDRRFSSLTEEEAGTLFKEIRFVCREALRIIGTDYSDPPATWLFLYRWKDGGICPVSKKPLQRDTVGGRTTCWSPALQR